MADCLCDNLEIESCPPYAAKKSFDEYLAVECNVCSGVVPVATTMANLKTAAGIDSCCEEIIINRGNQVIYSIDGGTNWLETGVRRLGHVVAFGSTSFTSNVSVTPNITSSSASGANEIPVTYSNNRFTITEGGTYLYHFNFVISPTATIAAGNFIFEILKNGASFNPRLVASPLLVYPSVGNIFHSFQGSMSLAANDGISFRFVPSVTFTSNPTEVYIDMWKVGS